MGVLDRFRLDGKRALVTGGSRGLGREMALALADAGAEVVIVARDPAGAAATAAEIERAGRRAAAVCGDLGVPEACEEVCGRAIREHGPIDILVNNVGGRRESIPTESMPLETWRRLVDLNLTSTFVCTKLVGGEMIRRGAGGRIITMGSILALVATEGIAGRHYEACKAAVVQFSRAVAADWAPHGITVNAILPGTFLTEPNRRWSESNPEAMERMRARIPLGHFGSPEDLGPLAVYLASDAARYVTGAAIVIDGGYTLW